MLLSITTTHRPATDLGYLLHKNPARTQRFNVNSGAAWILYPEASEERCTCTLLLDIDPVELSRRSRTSGSSGFSLFPYVNDRPYVASSFMSVAIADVFSSALNGNCRERPELAAQPIPLEVWLPVVPASGGQEAIRSVFEPLGYQLEITPLPLDERFPEWGESRYHSVRLRCTLTLQQCLGHLYVLLPVLDNRKHYWVSADETEKLMRHGGEWLAAHPARTMITRRYLNHRRSLVDAATEQLMELVAAEGEPDAETETGAGDADEQPIAELEAMNGAGVGAADAEPSSAVSTAGEEAAGNDSAGTSETGAGEQAADEEAAEPRVGLHTERLNAVCERLVASGARRVLDLGCGEGKLLARLERIPQFTELVGMDVSARVLAIAASRFRRLATSERARQRLRFLHGSLAYRDERLRGFDAAALVEVIEHLDPFRLATCAELLFGDMRPGTVIITTPNREYNVVYETLAHGTMRHTDHRFEWTRDEFRAWCIPLAERFGYAVEFVPIGEEHPEHGSPTQMGVFTIC